MGGYWLRAAGGEPIPLDEFTAPDFDLARLGEAAGEGRALLDELVADGYDLGSSSWGTPEGWR